MLAPTMLSYSYSILGRANVLEFKFKIALAAEDV
jgi:hypothetical protein